MSLCPVANSRLTACNPCTVAHRAPLFIIFFRQEYWSELPFPPPGHLSHPGVQPNLYWQAEVLPVSHQILRTCLFPFGLRVSLYLLEDLYDSFLTMKVQ